MIKSPYLRKKSRITNECSKFNERNWKMNNYTQQATIAYEKHIVNISNKEIWCYYVN